MVVRRAVFSFQILYIYCTLVWSVHVYTTPVWMQSIGKTQLTHCPSLDSGVQNTRSWLAFSDLVLSTGFSNFKGNLLFCLIWNSLQLWIFYCAAMILPLVLHTFLTQYCDVIIPPHHAFLRLLYFVFYSCRDGRWVWRRSSFGCWYRYTKVGY